MSLSSDEQIKNEIIDHIKGYHGPLKPRIFPQSSNQDQFLFQDGGLTFSADGVSYGSCDACWFDVDESGKEVPVIALEGTDALNRGSSGNAQYQRFHHALGASKSGIIGIYYLRKGKSKIQEDLFGMAYYASQYEKGPYLIIDNLDYLVELLCTYPNKKQMSNIINQRLQEMQNAFIGKFTKQYNDRWEDFARDRSTIIFDDLIVKHAARSRRNFTDSSQRAGHIAVGEMYLTKYYFFTKRFYYLFPRMTFQDRDYLDKNKSNDKEWFLLRHEPGVDIKTVDEIDGLPRKVKQSLIELRDTPLKGADLKTYNNLAKEIERGLISGALRIL